VDLLFNLIAVPIGISRSSSGFNTAEFVFLETFEGTGNGNFGMNWLLGFYLGAGCLAGFDAAGKLLRQCTWSLIETLSAVFLGRPHCGGDETCL
jgi:hypothetical protein